MSITINWFSIVWHILAITLIATGKIPWWVYLLVWTSHIKVKSTFHVGR